MRNTDLILFDDRRAEAWEPFALTRPAGELMFGTMTLRGRVERAFEAICIGHVAAHHLDGFEEPDAAPVVTAPTELSDRTRIFFLSRAVPDSLVRLPDGFDGRLSMEGRIIGWVCRPGSSPPDADFFQDPAGCARGGDVHELSGTVVENVWELVSRNPQRITRDVESRFSRPAPADLPQGAFHWGEYPLIVDPTASIEPGSAFDTSGGPIWIDREAHVRAFTRLAGPAYVGPGSILIGGSIEAASIGPVCRIRGELAESVCLGYVNKQHDGHIGHAYLGRWVNLGAETTNSDLKNNYGTIRIWTPAGETDTGEIKMGSLIGDHVKTGIGLLLNTGTVIGAGCNLYGSAMPPTYVPPFSWGSGADLVEYRLDRFLQVADRAMARRGVELSDAMKAQLSRAWTRGREHLAT